MKRREFLLTLGAATLAARAGSAQGSPPRVGVLALGNPDPAPFVAALKENLRELGYSEGQTVHFEFRSADRQPGKLAPLAAELVALPVDVLVAFQTPAATAAKQASTVIPIVMGGVGDPVESGLVSSLARPGGNITGVSGATTELGAKTLDLIREVLPSAKRVGLLANATDPFSRPFVSYIEAASRTLGIELKVVRIGSADELDGQIAGIAAWQGQAIVVQPTLPHRRVAELAMKHGLPAFCPHVTFVGAGGLLGYSADSGMVFRQTAAFVDKILKGRKPADLPVELPVRFQLFINLKTAKALRLTIPGTMLTRADEVVE